MAAERSPAACAARAALFENGREFKRVRGALTADLTFAAFSSHIPT
jgi:hypothetical protein